MEISIIGIIVILLSIYAFFKNEKLLLDLVIFFSIFVAASAMIITKTQSATVPYKIPLYLWLFKQFLNIIKNRKKITKEYIKDLLVNNKIFTAFLVFMIVMFISVFYLFISGMDFTIIDAKEITNVKFAFSNLRQAIGISVFIVFVMLLSIKVKTKEEIKHLLKVFLMSTLFAVIWGYIQYILFYLNIDYPAFLFNNNPGYYQGYDQIMHGIKRVNSVGTEPSVFALNLLTAFPLVFIPYLFNKNKNSFLRSLLVVLFAVCIIITTSSTAMVGMVVIVGCIFIYLLYNAIKKKNLLCKKAIPRMIIILSISFVIGLGVCLIGNRLYNSMQKEDTPIEIIDDGKKEEPVKTDESVIDALEEITVSKILSGSGQERLEKEKIGLKVYKTSPIFGVGLGSFRTFTLFTNVLVNMGIIGLLSLLYIYFVLFRQMIKNRKRDEKYYFVFIITIIGFTSAYLASIPDLIYTYTWSIIVLAYNYFDIKPSKKDKKQLIIGVDARGLDGNKTGISIYIDKLLEQFNEMKDLNVKFILYSTRDINLSFKPKENIEVKRIYFKKGVIFIRYLLPKLLVKDNVDIFWGTQHLLPVRNEYTENIKFILTVHDLAIHKLKTVGSKRNTLIHKLFFKKSCQDADIIISVSESTKNDLIEIFEIESKKIEVVYHGVNNPREYLIDNKEEKKILNKFDVVKDNYLFFVSTIEPRKNIVTLVKAFNLFKDKKEYKDYKLVLAGGLGWKYESILEEINNSKYKDDIKLAGYVSNDEKECLMHNTKCFVYPSLYEGFGLPILEAMQKGVLVVTSYISSIPEVGGEVPYYLKDVYDEKELASLLEEACSISEKEKNTKIKNGYKQVDKFTWEKCADETLKILAGGTHEKNRN